ncbi:Hypothetical predicted protein [Paramuricea clavata]|uniref:Uncharacterized protein n=1 Tax=Paramuricea clavata TaxID=317549 RepID=A0A7D9J9F9_PARCT|nr:Hypothetical predicted protein [Paramuricea clavata]
MDPVITLKRSSQIDVNACIFCQTSLKDQHLRAATDYSRTVVRDAMNLRSKFRDVGNRETISRLEEVINSIDSSIVWHVKCYSLFTSKDKIQRLEKTCNKDEATARPNSSPSKPRAQTEQVDWDKCAFCQVHTNEHLSSVMTFKMSEQIIEISNASKRSRDKTKSEINNNDLALVWFSKELEYAADKGHVIRLDDVWERYTILAEKAGNTLPSLLSVEGRLFRTNLCIWLETS